MKQRLLKLSSIIAGVAFVGVFYGLAVYNTPGSDAVKATDFKAGRIIDDSVFYNANTMSVTDIQNFLDRNLPACDMWGTGSSAGRVVSETGYRMPAGSTNADYARLRRSAGNTKYHEPPYVCVNKYYENPTTHETLYDTKGVVKSGMISAAQIIYNEAKAYNINPQVLLVLLKKESYVWGDSWPLKWEYNSAMGYGCPDNAPCDAKYYGFYNQMHMAAWQLNYYRQHINSYNYRPYMTNNIYYSPDYSCGTKAVYLENIATTSLYIYTPYTPNDAALRNYPGTSVCGSYGNRNFFMYFSEWFGSTLGDYFEKAKKQIENYYESLGGENSYLKKAKGDMICGVQGSGTNRCYQQYEIGYIYSTDNYAWDISGGMLSRWTALGGANSALRYPTSAEKRGLVRGGAVQAFDYGNIYWTPEKKAWDVSGGILSQYVKMGTEWGALGYPTSGEQKDTNGVTYQQFENGRIYWTAKNGAWVINDHYVQRWNKLGATKSIFKYSKRSEICGLVKGGCYLPFEAGNIYWHPTHGAWDVSGGILSQYVKMGTEWGALGYPTSGEQKDTNGVTYQQFENGRIYWTAKNGAWVKLGQ